MATLDQQIARLRADPLDESAAEDVRALGREQGAFEAYAQAFSARARALAEQGDVSAAIRARVEAALVYEEDLRALAEAAAQYEAVLQLEPLHRRALFCLGLLLHDLKRWDDLIALYRRRIAATDHNGEQTTLHLYSAEVLAERKGDDNAAFVEVMAAARLAPQNIRIIGRLEALGAKTDRHSEVAVTLGDLILNQEDPKVRAALSLRLAELHLGPLGDEVRALSYLRAALADDGGNPHILKELEDVFRERDRFDELAQLLEVSAEDRRVGPHRVRLERELARIYELQLDDAPRALLALRRAISHAPDDRELLDEVMRLGLITGDLAGVAETYEGVLSRTDNALLQNYVLLKLGHIYGNVLSRTDDAVRVYWSILEHEPSHGEARRRLLRIHERKGDDREVARLLEMEIVGQEGAPETFATLERLLTLYTDRIDDPERAVEACRRLLELDPEHSSALDVMQSQRPETPETSEPVEAPARATPPPPPPRDAFDAVTDSAVMVGEDESATVFDGEGYGPESETQFADQEVSVPRVAVHASAVHMQVEGDGPVPGHAIEEEDSDSTIALLDDQVLYEEAAVGVDSGTPVESSVVHGDSGVRMDSGTLAEGEAAAGDADSGTPQHSAGADDQGVVARDSGTSAEHPASGSDSASGTDPGTPAEDRVAPEEPVVARDSGTPHEGEAVDGETAGDRDSGTPHKDPVVDGETAGDRDSGTPHVGDVEARKLEGGDSDAQHPSAPAEQAPTPPFDGDSPREAGPHAHDPEGDGPPEPGPEVPGLPAVQEVPEQEALHPAPFLSVVAEASAALREKADEEGPSHGLATRVQEIRRELEAADPEASIALLEELLAITESQEDDEASLAALAQLTDLDPSVERVQDLLRLGRSLKAWPLLIERVQAACAALPLPEQVPFLRTLAQIELTELKDPAAAAQRLGQLYQQTHDGEVFGAWLSALEQAELHEEVVQALLRRAGAESDPRDGQLFLQRAVALLDSKLDAPSRAADALIEFMDVHPQQEGLQEEAAGFLHRAERWSDLVQLLTQRMARLEESERAELRLRIAALQGAQLNDSVAAEATLRQGLEERASDPDLLMALWQVLESSQQWHALVDVGLRRVEVVQEPAERCELRLSLAQVLDAELEDPTLAEELLSAALTDDARNLDVLRHLEKLRRARDDWDGVYDVLELQVAACDAADERAQTLFALAQVRAESKGDLDGAVGLLRQAVELQPEHDEALGYLAQLEERRGDFVGAADVLRVHIEAREPSRRAPLHARLGALLASHFGDLEGARSEYEAVLELEPAHLESQLALLAIEESDARYLEAHAYACQAAQCSEDPRQSASLYVKAGQIAERQLGDERKAITAYQEALEADPEDLVTEARLGELFSSRGDHEAAHPHLFRAAHGLSDPQRATELFIVAGQTAERCGDESAAILAYEAVLEQSATQPVALDRLGELLVERQEWARAYEVSTTLILHHEAQLAPKERAQVFLRMARAQQGTEQMEGAHRFAKRAHHLDPGLDLPLRIMADALEGTGEAFEAAECLKRLAQLASSEQDKAACLLRAGRLLQEQADDPARAAAMLTEAQAVDPTADEIAQRLAVCRAAVNDAPGAATALQLLAGHRQGRARADLLTQAARVLLGAHRERERARDLLQEALQVLPTHLGARRDLEVLLEFDSDLEALADLWLGTAEQFERPGAPAEDLDDVPAEQVSRELRTRAMHLYRDRLEDPARALGVLRTLMQKDGPEAWQEPYARLLDAQLEAAPEQEQLIWEAIRAWALLVEQRPGRVEALHRLYALRMQAGEAHLAQLVVEILSALQQPLPEGSGPLLDLAPPDAAEAVSLPATTDEASELQTLLKGLEYAPMKAMQDILPEARLKKKELVGAAGLGIHISRPLQDAARVLGVPVPPVYVREEAEAGVTPSYAADGPALVVSLSKLTDCSAPELRFIFGRALSLLSAGALAVTSLPPEALREALAGLAKLPDPSAAFAEAKAAKRRGRALEKALAAEQRADLAVQAATWLSAPDRASLCEAQQDALRAAERAGLIVSGSLQTALQTLRLLSGDRMERRWRMPLIRFAATRDYAEMMRRRG